MSFDLSELRLPTRETVYGVACDYLPERLRLLGVAQQNIGDAVNCERSWLMSGSGPRSLSVSRRLRLMLQSL